MRRPLLWLIAIVIAVAPTLADVCRVDCERERPPECPLHQPAPRTCSHAHTIGSATLTQASADTQRPAVAAFVVATPGARLERVALELSCIDHQHIPPLRSPRAAVLRI
jgi:hypothetical protein